MLRLFLAYMLEKFDIQGLIFFILCTPPQIWQESGEVCTAETSPVTRIFICFEFCLLDAFDIQL